MGALITVYLMLLLEPGNSSSITQDKSATSTTQIPISWTAPPGYHDAYEYYLDGILFIDSATGEQ